MGRGRPPKCKICGKQLKADTAYMVLVCNSKGTEKKTFYCSQEEYEENTIGTKKVAKKKKGIIYQN